MELAQIFILALCVVSVTMRRCYNKTELEEKALKMLKNFQPPPNVTPSPNSSSGCPVESFKSLASGFQNDRSISPWKYETVEVPEFYPQTYTQAVCLCQGCIMVNSSGSVIEDYSYNSAKLNISWMFVKREKCQKGGYKLNLVRQDVTVGCTCVKPSLSHSPPIPATPAGVELMAAPPL
ncbi:interleukin-17C [Poecilia reticulata]|uniref:interleukin-17C n=1 Tax=Poecilia reticulata TaxID=8081 RepID=UPI0004A33E86|nr:PREDICTED: interleukin-17C [Poecilia reticulata]